MISSPEVTLLKDWLNSKPEIELAMLYGSFATGKQRADSDLDLAILLTHHLSVDERIAYAQELEFLLKRKVDLVDLSQAHSLILKEIIAANTFLLNRNQELFAKLLLRLWFEEADFGPIRKNIMDARRSRVFGS